jgi:hypothetical protein
MPEGTFVAWIGAKIRPPAGGMLVSDAWVDPASRGGNVHRWGAALAVRELVRLGATIVTAGVEEHEFAAMASLYARLGLGVCVPDYSYYWLRVGRTAGVHWRARAPRALRRWPGKLEDTIGGPRKQA